MTDRFDLSDVDAASARHELTVRLVRRAQLARSSAYSDGWRACSDYLGLEATITDGVPIEEMP